MTERSVEELFNELKKLPDWDRYPYPEVFYKHFGVSKPKPASLMEALTYTPPPSELVAGDTVVPKDTTLRPVGYQGLPVNVEVPEPVHQPFTNFQLNWNKILSQQSYEAKRDSIVKEIQDIKEQYKAGAFKQIEMAHN